MDLESILEKIKRLENGGNGSNMVCFIVAFDLLYFLNDTDNRKKFVYDYYKNDNSMFSGNLKRICYYCESILLKDSIYDNMLKNIEMEIRRDDLVSMYNYYDTMDKIEKANNSAKKLISDGFKIRLLNELFSSSNDEYVKLNEKVASLKDRYDRNMIDIVTIISLFIAVVIGMVSGVGFTLKAFDTINATNIKNVCLLASVVGFVLFNFFYMLLKFVSNLSGRDIDRKGHILFVEVVFIALIVFFVVLTAK